MDVLYQTRIQKERFQDRCAARRAAVPLGVAVPAGLRGGKGASAAPCARQPQPRSAALGCHLFVFAPRLPHRPDDYEKAKGKYIVNAGTMQLLKKEAVVLHPLPRVDEVRACSGGACPHCSPRVRARAAAAAGAAAAAAAAAGCLAAAVAAVAATPLPCYWQAV